LERALGRPLIAKGEFLEDLRTAMDGRTGYAAGKLGNSEKRWLYYPIFMSRTPADLQRRAYEASLFFHSAKQAGLFPATAAFLREYVGFYLPHVRNLDCVGLVKQSAALEAEIVRAHGVRGKLIHFVDQEPDRSSPDEPARCYLPFLRGRRLLLVSSYARLLCERANRETFEAVWMRTGKKWFDPLQVEAVEFPYGFSRRTQHRYPTSLALFADITAEIARRRFDVALIAAGGLSVPLASFVKSLGKVGVSLGGHLQILFGIRGERWRQPKWEARYVNSAWIDFPPEYRLEPGESYENYW
jgi:hypothetical protein